MFASNPLSPLLECAIEASSQGDAATVAAFIEARRPHHPRCLVAHVSARGSITLGADDEAALQAFVEDLRSGVTLRVGTLSISHRETVARAVEIAFTANEAALRRVARITLAIAPGPAPCFVSRVDALTVSPEIVAAVEAGVAEAMAIGVGWGDRVVGTVITLTEVDHDGTAAADTFRCAGRDACRRGLSDAGTLRLEPMMRLRIAAPAASADTIRRDLLARRARIDAIDVGEVGVALEARVPLASVLGYRAVLHRLSDGSGIVALALHAFEPVGASEPPRFPGAIALRA